ncbi:unnamed protein product [Cyclocybe aegerita]|uniref:C2H2-type domain-containing protein n=1 Tax=Cyclocybe aegerita TaxID=1973307 RepID=A0A8S0WZC2_CYCAE|nr:unnamed protein product [Cyclocybe aegerita]
MEIPSFRTNANPAPEHVMPTRPKSLQARRHSIFPWAPRPTRRHTLTYRFRPTALLSTTSTMNAEHDRTHAQVLESTSSFPSSDLHMPRVKNISVPRLQCQILSSLHPAPPESPSTLSAMINTASVDLNADGNQSNIDHITSLERSLCSNFMCCGVRLADFHALLEHFEEDHIMVLAPNGKRIYPPQGLRSAPMHTTPPNLAAQQQTPTPGSSRSSSVTPSEPAPPTPVSASLSLPAAGPSKRKSSVAIAPVYTPFTPSLPVDPADPYSDSTDITMAMGEDDAVFAELYPTFSNTEIARMASSELSPLPSEDEEMSDGSTSASPIDIDVPMSPIPTYVYGVDKQPITEIPKTVRFSKGAVGGGSRKVSSASSSKPGKARSRYGSAGGAVRRREKSFKCPTPRCTKSYLNPNGLKYHLEKGTCKFDDDSEADPDLSMSDDTNPRQTTRKHPSPTPVASTSTLLLPPAPKTQNQKPHPKHSSSTAKSDDAHAPPHAPGTVPEHASTMHNSNPNNSNFDGPKRDMDTPSTRRAGPAGTGPGGPAGDEDLRPSSNEIANGLGSALGYCHPLGDECSSVGQEQGQKGNGAQLAGSSTSTSQIQPITAPTTLTVPLSTLPRHQRPPAQEPTPSSTTSTSTTAATQAYQYQYPPGAYAHTYAIAYAQRAAYYTAGSASSPVPSPAPPVAMTAGSSSASARSQ